MSYLDLCMKELIQVQKIQRDLAINELKRRQQSNNNNNGPSVAYSNLAQLYKTFQCPQQQPATTIQQQPQFGQLPQLNFLGIINIPNGNANRGNQQQNNQQMRQNRPSNLMNTVITNTNQNSVTATSTVNNTTNTTSRNIQSDQTNPNIPDECSNSMPCSSNSTNPNIDAEKEEEEEQIVDVESVENDKNDKEEKIEEDKSENGDKAETQEKCREIKSEFEGEASREMEKEEKFQNQEMPEVEIKQEIVETSEINEMIAANEHIENGISQKSDNGEKGGKSKMTNKEEKDRAKVGKSRKPIEEYSEKNREPVPEKLNNIECEWTDCEAKFADDNQLYDHIKKKHIMEPNQNDDDDNYDADNSFGCKWQKCDQSPRRGNAQRKHAWLLNHILVRHTPKAEIHICLFVGCKLRFKKVQALTQHLHMAHAEHGEQPRKRGRKRKNPVQLFHHRDQQTKEDKIDNTNTEIEEDFGNRMMANQIDEEEKIFGLDKEEE